MPLALSSSNPGTRRLRTAVRVRFQIIRNERVENVGKSQSCMVYKLRIIWKQTVSYHAIGELLGFLIAPQERQRFHSQPEVPAPIRGISYFIKHATARLSKHMSS